MTDIPNGTTSIDDLTNEINNTINNTITKLADEILADDEDIDILEDEDEYEDEYEDDNNNPPEAVSPVEYEEDGEDDDGEEEDGGDIGEKQNPTIQFLGYTYDRDSAIVGLILIIIWIIIWKTSGLWKTLRYDISFIVIFFLLILYIIANIATAGTSSGGVVYELNILLTVEQMISILFGTVVLFALFGKNLPIHENCRHIILRLSMSIVVILTTASLWVNLWTSGRAFRSVRKFKQGIYNVALTLFIIIGLIFIKGSKCPAVHKVVIE
jgi:hypothetical protein